MSDLKYYATIEKNGESVCVFDNEAHPGTHYFKRIELTPDQVRTVIDFRHPAPFTADLPNLKYDAILEFHPDPFLIEQIPTSELKKAVGLQDVPHPDWAKGLEFGL